ncbi:MAG: cytochrome c biogenesis protein CcsA [bacterium]|nr:cytochrome c biogenesis protein CcsA [bacterium]
MSTLDVKLFYVAFWLYFAGFIAFSLYITFRKDQIWRIAARLMAVGLIPQTAAIITRWLTSEHVPLSNMYEYMSLMSWMAVILLLVLIKKYRRPLVGSFISPLVFMLMVTASLLPKDVSMALVPALQSYWITIHVTLAALGSGAFVVACAVGFIYLMKIHQRQPKSTIPGKTLKLWAICFIAFPVVFYFLLRLFGFELKSDLQIAFGGIPVTGWGSFLIGLGLATLLAGIGMPILYNLSLKKKDSSHFGSNFFAISIFALLIAALIAGLLNTGGIFTLSERSPLRIFEFFGMILILYWPMMLICYSLLYSSKGNFLNRIDFNLDLLDEINYKAITIGYPLYTVGALFAGAIWAEKAWGSFWSWDPKEVGSLVIWLFYSGFLHARFQRQWKGPKAAILAVFGLLMVILSFFGNYFFGGAHSYT